MLCQQTCRLSIITRKVLYIRNITNVPAPSDNCTQQPISQSVSQLPCTALILLTVHTLPHTATPVQHPHHQVGVLVEIFQWKGEVVAHLPDWSSAERHHVAAELSGVLLYLIRLADVCGVDLGRAALNKLANQEAL